MPLSQSDSGLAVEPGRKASRAVSSKLTGGDGLAGEMNAFVSNGISTASSESVRAIFLAFV